MFRKFCVLGLVLSLGVAPVWARKYKYREQLPPLTAQQKALIRTAMVREQATIKAIEKDTPVVQTYIQNLRPDPVLYQVPVSDQYSVARVDFGKAFSANAYEARKSHRGWFRGSFQYLKDLTKSFQISDNPTGFMDMMFVDPRGFNFNNYSFAFVRQQFLGEIRTSVFDVRPKRHAGSGRFFGRIWVENDGGNIVRFNGTYTNNPNNPVDHYYHFDSWRKNIQPGLWLPYAIYVEETHSTSSQKSLALRGQTFYWGYALKIPQQVSESESVNIENAQDESQNARDLSPLQAERHWIVEAQDNVLDRLQQAGLLAAPSPFDKVLDTVTNNILIGNNLNLPYQIHCRVMLTEPLESLAVGNTILLSKGLIDVLPNEEDLAAVISFQLAQILLGHHIDTRYAFSDRLLFPDEAAFQRIDMNHSMADDASAAKKAVELFDHSVYASKSPQVGLFFEQLMAREKALKNLLTPRLGDSLIQPDGQPWLAAFLQGAPPLNMKNLNQIAALPLDSHLKINPWTDEVQTLNLSPAPLLTPADKMPFEITPVYFRLRPYQPPATTQGANPTPDNGSNPAPPAPQVLKPNPGSPVPAGSANNGNGSQP
ncbi:MAG: hypothetical protein M1568_03580 [Acidobacteria bacterium]|jgi:hypothetical protein|nr:hypothetical protein [Acidobacteriota bacterium]